MIPVLVRVWVIGAAASLCLILGTIFVGEVIGLSRWLIVVFSTIFSCPVVVRTLNWLEDIEESDA